ncbi:RNA 2'-phosphotransferase [Dactylosporangium sp. CA-233914]|uniref:RNA 2'-phosphotransferase n=1 Tax=Dactylosporangium sp. CA-233914 TaxID=3239934 RepID=UPI003D90CD43
MRDDVGAAEVIAVVAGASPAARWAADDATRRRAVAVILDALRKMPWPPGGRGRRIGGDMEYSQLVKISKRMSKALRHDPARVGIRLDPAGWVPVTKFLTAMRIDRATLDEVVAGNDKQRFAVAVGDDGVERIRANQGHSVPVELGLAEAEPPEVLFHGTSAAVLGSIRATGLNRGGRHHVHLSPDTATARRVGARRGGAIVILTVLAGPMHRAGHMFYRSDNGVWLTDEVPPEFIRTD